MTRIEDAVASEAHRLGLTMKAEAMRQAAVDLAGGEMIAHKLGFSDNHIFMPGKGTISLRDFVRSLHRQMPNAFEKLADDKPKDKPQATGNVTADMRREIAANRLRNLPDDWHDKRKSVVGLTAAMMDELKSERTGR